MAAAEQNNNNNKKKGGGEYMKRKRSKNWTRNETLSLIRARSDELQEANSGGGKDLPKSQLWHQISQRLRRENIARDAQQCRDKWEKLSASYKLKNPADNPFFQALHPLLSKNPKHYRHHRDDAEDSDETEDENNNNNNNDYVSQSEDEENDETKEVDLVKYRELLHGFLDEQRRFFRELMAALDDRRQRRDRDRAEYEERWRAEERAQRCRLTAAMSALVSGAGGSGGAGGTGKRRSKNWKRAEVAALIRQRSRLRHRFGRRSGGRRVATVVAAASASASASAWEEVSEALRREGIGRDAKQCREKWDKLVAEYKDVLLRRKPSGTVSQSAAFPYFADVAAVLAPPTTPSAHASTSTSVAMAVASVTPASPSSSSASGSASASASASGATAVAVL